MIWKSGGYSLEIGGDNTREAGICFSVCQSMYNSDFFGGIADKQHKRANDKKKGKRKKEIRKKTSNRERKRNRDK
jgi:hypothetical protein